MRQSAKIKLGGGSIGSLTPDTILYGRANNITDIDYENITVHPLNFKYPFKQDKIYYNVISYSNEITLDPTAYYYKDEIDNLFQSKITSGLGINLNNSNISVNFADGGWNSNYNSNYLITTNSPNIGIGTTKPFGTLHINNNNASLIIDNNISKFVFSYNDFYFSLGDYYSNQQFKINKNAPNNSLIIDRYGNINIGSNLFINGTIYLNSNIIIDNSNIISWLNNNGLATIDFVRSNQNLNNDTQLLGKGNLITNLDYNNITLNKLIFLSPFIFNSSNNSVGIDLTTSGWINSNNNLYLNFSNLSVGIGTNNPLSLLHIGTTNFILNSKHNDGSIMISKSSINNNKNFKIGFDDNFNFSLGHYIINSSNWNKQLLIYNLAPSNSLIIDNLGNININNSINITSNINITNGIINFNNKFNISYDTNNNFNIGNNCNFIINNGNIGLGILPNPLFRFNVNGNVNINSNLHTSNIFSSNAFFSNLIIYNNLIINSNLNVSNIINVPLIRCSSNIISPSLNTNNLISSNNITTNSLNVYSNIITNYIYSSNINSINYIKTNSIVASTINTDIINVSNINTSNIILTNLTANIINTSILNSDTNIIACNLNIETINVNDSINVNNTINTNYISTHIIDTTDINSSNINTNNIKTDILNVNSNIITNNLITNNLSNNQTFTTYDAYINNNLITSNTIKTYNIDIENNISTNSIICNKSIGININNPIGLLHIQNSSFNNNDASFIISGINNSFRFGYDENNNFIFGTYNNNKWIKQFYINYNSPENSFNINSLGNIGIGVINNNLYNYKVDINGSVNATIFYQNGELLATKTFITSSISNALNNYYTNDIISNTYASKIYVNNIIQTSNSYYETYLTNSLSIDSNILSAEQRLPTTTYIYSNVSNTPSFYENSNIYGFKETITETITNADNSITSNSYTIYSSTGYADKELLFNYIDTKPIYSCSWGSNNYSYGTFVYSNMSNTSNTSNTSNYIYNISNLPAFKSTFFNVNPGYYGDYIIIKFDNPVILTRFKFYSVNSFNIDNRHKAPGHWKCYGSLNGSNWTEIINASKDNNLSVDSNFNAFNQLGISDYIFDINSNCYYEKKVNNNIAYTYIGFIINQLALSINNPGTTLELTRIELFCKKNLNPLYISSNVLLNYLSNYSTITQLNTKQDNNIQYIAPLYKTGNNISLDVAYIIPNNNDATVDSLSNLIVSYINSLTNIWAYVPNFPNNIFYNYSGSIGIGTTIPNSNYKLDIYGNISANNINILSNINTSNLIATKIIGDGSGINNINFNNITINKPNFDNINNVIYYNNNFYYFNDTSANVGIGVTFDNYPTYKLTVNGSILSYASINTFANLQENNINLKDKYLTISNASNNYLSLNGGIISGSIGINTNISSNFILNVNGSIKSYSNIYANHFIENGNFLSNIYLSIFEANNNYLSILDGGNIRNNLFITSNLGIGTNYILDGYKLDVNGSIISHSNINALSFIENNIPLTSKYLSISNASNLYLSINGGIISNNLIINSNLSIGTFISSNYTLNVNGNINSTGIFINGSNIDFNSFLTINSYNSLIQSYPTLTFLSNNYITSNNFNNIISSYSTTGNDPNYLKLSQGGIISANTTFTGLLITSNISIGTSLTSSNYLLNINGSLNTTGIYINGSNINFNSYMTYDYYNSNLQSFPTYTYLSNNYISTTMFNYKFLSYSTTGNDPNYLKITSNGIIDNNITFTGNITYSNSISFINNINANLTGNVTGNLTGNLNGSVIGNLTGNVIGNITGNVIGDVISSNISTSNLITTNIGINTSISQIYKLNVNGSIYSSNNIICSGNFIENGSNLINKYLTISSASNTYLSFSGGSINNLGIGTSISQLYKLNVNGSIYASNNIYSSNFIENGSNLSDKYVMINNLSTYLNNNNDLVNFQKKYGIRFNCANEIIINNITYYKHDINLTTYIKNKYDSTDGSPYKIFNIKCFSTNAIFNAMTSNKPPNILQYDIYMSYSISSNIISACAIGFPSNYYLNRITAGDIFILKTNNYNYISILSKNINTSVSCIISDFLF